jgi:hypothetical protein
MRQLHAEYETVVAQVRAANQDAGDRLLAMPVALYYDPADAYLILAFGESPETVLLDIDGTYALRLEPETDRIQGFEIFSVPGFLAIHPQFADAFQHLIQFAALSPATFVRLAPGQLAELASGLRALVPA